MEANKIAQDNHAFFYVAVGQTLCDHDFWSGVLQGFDEPALCGVKVGSYSGYINVDVTALKEKGFQGSFSRAVREGIIGRVAMQVPCLVSGDLNTKVSVVQDGYRFQFEISKYERGPEHGFEMVEDPRSLSDDEQLNRFVDLKITAVQ